MQLCCVAVAVDSVATDSVDAVPVVGGEESIELHAESPTIHAIAIRDLIFIQCFSCVMFVMLPIR